MYGPVLTGSTFRLRPPREEDARLFSEWFADLEVTRYLKLRTAPSVHQEREWVERNAASDTDIVWCIEFEDQLVGTTGVHAIDWRNGHGRTGTVLGDRAAWGKGIGGELMCVRRDYLFREFRLNKLKSGYLEGNEASARAQRAAGYPGGRPPAPGILPRGSLARPNLHRGAPGGLGAPATIARNRNARSCLPAL